MARRGTSLNNTSDFGVGREIGSKYDAVKTVANNIVAVEKASGLIDYIDPILTVESNIANVNAVGSNINVITTVSNSVENVDAVGSNIDSVNTVASVRTDVVTVASISDEITSLYNDKSTLDSLYADKITLDSLYADKLTLDSLYSDKTKLDSLYNDKATLDSLFSDKETLDSLYADKITLDSLYADKVVLDSLYNDKTTLDRIYNSINNIDRVYTSIDNVDRVSVSSDNLDRVFDSIDNLDRVYTSSDNIDIVATDINNVNTTATNIIDVNTVAGNIANINTVASIQNLANITTVAEDLNSLDLNGIADITVVANDLIKDLDENELTYSSINKVSADITNVNIVAENTDNIDTVAGNTANINIVANIDSDVSTLANISENVSTVTAIADDVTTVANIDQEVTTLAAIDAELVSLYNDKAALDSLYADKITLDSLYGDKVTLDSLYADKAVLDSLFNDKPILDSLFSDKAVLDSLYADKAVLDSLFNDKITLDSLYSDKIKLDSIYADKIKLDSLYEDKENLDAIANDLVNLDNIATSVVPNISEILLADDNAVIATNNAGYSQEWAINPEDTLVSTGAGGNGTSDYSALHYAAKASNFSSLASSAKDAAESAQVAAEEAQAASELALDEFTDIYLGTFEIDPTLDNDGNSLKVGALYYNSVDNHMKVYTGTEWNPVVFDASGVVLSFNGREGDVTLTNEDITSATGQDLSNVGTPSFASVTLTGGTSTEGTLSWNDSDRTLNLDQGGVTLQLGQETLFMVRNAGPSTIQNGTLLGFAGVTVGSNRIIAEPFDLNTMGAHQLIGVATEDISSGVNGLATTLGYVRGLDTRGTAASGLAVGDEDWSVGDILYAHPTVPGKLTSVAPIDGFDSKICVVVNRHQTAGEVFVRITPIDMNHYKAWVQDKLDIVSGSISNHLLDYENPHNVVSTQIAVTPNGNLSSNNVQLALQELQSDIDNMDTTLGSQIVGVLV